MNNKKKKALLKRLAACQQRKVEFENSIKAFQKCSNELAEKVINGDYSAQDAINDSKSLFVELELAVKTLKNIEAEIKEIKIEISTIGLAFY